MTERFRQIVPQHRKYCSLCEGAGEVNEGELHYRKGQGFFWNCETELAIPRRVPCWICDKDARDKAERSSLCPICHGQKKIHSSKYYRLGFTGQVEWSCCGAPQPCVECPACKVNWQLPEATTESCPCCKGVGKIHPTKPRTPEKQGPPYCNDGPEPTWLCCRGFMDDAAPCKACPLCVQEGRLWAEKSKACPVCRGDGAIHRSLQFRYDNKNDRHVWDCCGESKGCLPCPVECSH